MTSKSTARLEVGQFSHPGRRRPNNEDWLGAFRPDDPGRLARKGAIFLVADGMGGHRSGERASRQAVDHVIRGYLDDPAADVGTGLRRAIEAANASLYERGTQETGQSRAGTTLVAAVVRDDALWVANVGDSRAYLLRGGRLRQLTRDHALFPSGAHPDRHLITRALGTRPQIEVDLFPPLALRRGDRVVLCSDGLTAPLSDDEIAAIAAGQRPQAGAEALVRAANERGGPDNVSVILVEVLELGVRRRLSASSLAEQVAAMAAGGRDGALAPPLLWVLLAAILALIGLGFVLGLLLFGG